MQLFCVANLIIQQPVYTLIDKPHPQVTETVYYYAQATPTSMVGVVVTGGVYSYRQATPTNKSCVELDIMFQNTSLRQNEQHEVTNNQTSIM